MAGGVGKASDLTHILLEADRRGVGLAHRGAEGDRSLAGYGAAIYSGCYICCGEGWEEERGIATWVLGELWWNDWNE